MSTKKQLFSLCFFAFLLIFSSNLFAQSRSRAFFSGLDFFSELHCDGSWKNSVFLLPRGMKFEFWAPHFEIARIACATLVTENEAATVPDGYYDLRSVSLCPKECSVPGSNYKISCTRVQNLNVEYLSLVVTQQGTDPLTGGVTYKWECSTAIDYSPNGYDIWVMDFSCLNSSIQGAVCG